MSTTATDHLGLVILSQSAAEARNPGALDPSGLRRTMVRPQRQAISPATTGMRTSFRFSNPLSTDR